MQAPLLQQRGMQPPLSMGVRTVATPLPRSRSINQPLVGDTARGSATRLAESPGPRLTPDLAPTKGRKSAAVPISRDWVSKYAPEEGRHWLGGILISSRLTRRPWEKKKLQWGKKKTLKHSQEVEMDPADSPEVFRSATEMHQTKRSKSHPPRLFTSMCDKVRHCF